MNIKQKVLLAAMSVGLVLGLYPALAFADEASTSATPESTNTQVVRIAGDTAAGASAAISKAAFGSSEWVVLVRDDDFADAVSATGLAGALNAPIILTDCKSLSEEARSEIVRLGATKCYVIGSTSDMAGDFEGELGKMGIDVSRVFGATSADTSAECAKKIAEIKQASGAPLDKAIVASSTDFQGALSISSFAYAYGVPIFLQTDGNAAADRSLTQEAQTLLKEQWVNAQVYVPGGPDVLSAASVEDILGANRVIRMYGNNCYDTSVAIAERLTTDGLLFMENVFFVCGAQDSKGLDALAGAAYAGKCKGVMLLTNYNEQMGPINIAAQEEFFAKHVADVMSVVVFGGTNLFPEAQVNRIQEIVDSVRVDMPDNPVIPVLEPVSGFEYVVLNGTEGYSFGQYVSQYSIFYYGAGAYIQGCTGTATDVVLPTQLDGANVVYGDLKLNSLTSLDLSLSKAIKYLVCSNNRLTSLDVSDCADLLYLDTDCNQLTSIDVSGCTSLDFLDCGNNQLTSLDVSDCTALDSLRCCDNDLTSLDVENNENLSTLACYFNDLTSLDVDNNTDLKFLDCSNNHLTSLNIDNNDALEDLYCYNNDIENTNKLETWLSEDGHSGAVTPQNE